MTPKKILILTADAGFGHRSASLAIESALHKLYDPFVHVDVVNALDDKRTPFFLRDAQTDYDKIVRKMPELYRIGYETSDSSVPSYIMDKSLLLLLYEVMRDILKKHQPDAIVLTYPIYQSALLAARQILHSSVPILTVITDLTSLHRIWFSKSIDKLLVSSEEAKIMALEYKVPEENIIVTGIPVSPHFNEITESKETLRRQLGWIPDKTTILAVGSNRIQQLASVLEVINHSGHDIQVIAVAGKDKTLYEKFNQMDWHIPHVIYDYVTDMPALMKASDAVISKAGGLIVTESLACGLPMMLIDIIPGQETGNADFVVSHNAGSVALDPVKILVTLSHWMNNNQQLLKEQTQNAQRIGNPNSALQAAKIIWDSTSLPPGKSNRATEEIRKSLAEFLEHYKIPQPDDSFTAKKDKL